MTIVKFNALASGPPDPAPSEPTVENVAAGQLRHIVERVERLHEERRSIDDDVKDIYGEARASGFDIKAIKRVIAARRKDRQTRLEEDLVYETYMRALGID